jgi:hypothetical protein
MQRLEVSGAVRYIYIYVIRRQRVKLRHIPEAIAFIANAVRTLNRTMYLYKAGKCFSSTVSLNLLRYTIHYTGSKNQIRIKGVRTEGKVIQQCHCRCLCWLF